LKDKLVVGVSWHQGAGIKDYDMICLLHINHLSNLKFQNYHSSLASFSATKPSQHLQGKPLAR
jgi:hypothetical protein